MCPVPVPQEQRTSQWPPNDTMYPDSLLQSEEDIYIISGTSSQGSFSFLSLRSLFSTSFILFFPFFSLGPSQTPSPLMSSASHNTEHSREAQHPWCITFMAPRVILVSHLSVCVCQVVPSQTTTSRLQRARVP